MRKTIALALPGLVLALSLTGCGADVEEAQRAAASATPDLVVPASPTPPAPTVTVTAEPEPVPTVTVTPEPVEEATAKDEPTSPIDVLMDGSEFWALMGPTEADSMATSICDGLNVGLTPQDIFEAGSKSGMPAAAVGAIMAYASYEHCPDYVDAMTAWSDSAS